MLVRIASSKMAKCCATFHCIDMITLSLRIYLLAGVLNR